MASPYFELAVAVKLKNHKFRWPNRISTTLYLNYVGGISLGINDTGGIYYKQIDRGDILCLCESSYSGYTGKSEEVIIEATGYSANVTTITIRSAGSYRFTAGDNVVIYATKQAENWDFDSVRVPKSIVPPGGGYHDRFALFQQAINGYPGQFGIYQTLSPNPFIESAIYRAVARYKYDVYNNSGMAKLIFVATDGEKNVINKTVRASDQLTWARAEIGDAASLSSPDLSSPSSSARFLIYQYLANTYDYSYMWLDSIFLEHASGIQFRSSLKNATAPSGASFATVFDNSGFTTPTSANPVYAILHGYDSVAGYYRNEVIRIFQLLSDGQTIYYAPVVSNPGAIYATGWIEEISNDPLVGGYYEFSDAAAADSIQYGYVDDKTVQRHSPNNLKMIKNDFEDRTQRMWFTCRFSNMDETNYQKIRKFLWWQQRGNLLNLHTFLDDLPDAMTGYMHIRDLGKTEHWDLTLRSFELYFEEA